jgi:NAD+ synthetase
MIDYKRVSMKMIDCLFKYIQSNHLQSVCIGISGGIDSTVSACLASIACSSAEIPLIGRSLPCNTNKIDEIFTAELVGKNFCSDFKTVSLEKMYLNLTEELALNEGAPNKIQSGNIKARLRMIYLRNLASIHKGIVLDNDNFTEWNLGFWTIGGDSPMDYNLGLHYLWKTEVYELAKFLSGNSGISKNRRLAIKKSIELTPTDGNGVSNSDCEQFGLDNYEQVDDILKTMYYNHYPNSIRVLSKNDLNKEYIRLIDSYNEQGVDKVMMLHQNTEYKRKELPIKPTKEELGL